MPKFRMTTLGCKVNQYESAVVRQTLVEAGLSESANGPADLVVVNTCCVTAAAAAKSRQSIRRAVRQSPEASVLVIGCYSDYDADRIARVLDDLAVPADRRTVAGHHDHALTKLPELLAGRGKGPSQSCNVDQPDRLRDSEYEEFMRTGTASRLAGAADPASIKARRLASVKANLPDTAKAQLLRRFPDRQRAFVAVQSGCDAFCTYCIVPFTRCRVTSRPIAEILDECAALVAAGHREIVLSGVFLGAFGLDTAIRRRWGNRRSTLPQLLDAVAAIDGLWRVRLSSLEPLDVTDELLEVLTGRPAVAPHLHLPLQSGSASVLRRMNRQYNPDQFRRCARRLRDALDEPALTTDIIVGFPGESGADFQDTLDLAAEAGFAKIHAFPFSAIKPTAAWQMRQQAPPPQVVRERMARLGELGEQLAGDYRRRFVGRSVEALVNHAAPGRARALTGRYLEVSFALPPRARPADWRGRVVRLDITAGDDNTLAGRLADAPPQLDIKGMKGTP